MTKELSAREILEKSYKTIRIPTGEMCNGSRVVEEVQEFDIEKALTQLNQYYVKKFKEMLPKKDFCYQEIIKLSVNELIPFEQIEPFKRLARLLDCKINQVFNDILKKLEEWEGESNERDKI